MKSNFTNRFYACRKKTYCIEAGGCLGLLSKKWMMELILQIVVL